MKLAALSVFSLVAGAALGGNASCSASTGLTVETSTGTYTGLIDPEFPNTRQFRAVPFAEPPVLSRRWLPPQKLSTRPGEHHYATNFPPSCPQFVTRVESIYSLNLTEGNLIFNGNQNGSSGFVGLDTSEDCLYSAIWTPTEIPVGGLPVLFFITGGGFVIGGVNIPWQLPPSWVERTRSHIVVTVNYRLDILGFPRARGLPADQQNLGILDQRAALEWVRDNIARFGGDPARITLWGQSSGSISADIHAYAWPDDPIARATWLMSGVVEKAAGGAPGIRQDPGHTNFSFVARHFGCAFACDSDGAAELDCMRRVPFARLVNFVGQWNDRGAAPALGFNAVVDGRVVFADYAARAAAGAVARVPALVSTTANEFSTLVPWPAANVSAGPYQAAVTAADVQAVCDILEATRYRARLGLPVFRLQYAGTYPNLNRYAWLGAYHASDLPLAFGTYRLLDGVAPTTDFEIRVSRALQDRALAFARDPYDGLQRDFGWLPLDPDATRGGYVLRLGADGVVSQRVDGDEVNGECVGRGVYDPFP
ncbi:acetylcholinesterase [Xylariomycetidae sp. FL2044]|nr:acetylcholinesterase [Xylariomycetidae sp. FL2044]